MHGRRTFDPALGRYPGQLCGTWDQTQRAIQWPDHWQQSYYRSSELSCQWACKWWPSNPLNSNRIWQTEKLLFKEKTKQKSTDARTAFGQSERAVSHLCQGGSRTESRVDVSCIRWNAGPGKRLGSFQTLNNRQQKRLNRVVWTSMLNSRSVFTNVAGASHCYSSRTFEIETTRWPSFRHWYYEASPFNAARLQFVCFGYSLEPKRLSPTLVFQSWYPRCEGKRASCQLASRTGTS